MTDKMVSCPACNGQGSYMEEMVNYVSHEMAMDACDMNYEGQPIYDEVEVQCSYCEGSGEVTYEEAEQYRNPPEHYDFMSDDDIPF